MNEVIFLKEEGIGYIEINRPNKLNALNAASLRELYSLLKRAEDDNEVKVIIIKGRGSKSFIAGADIEELEMLNSRDYREQVGLYFTKIVNKIMNLSKPVIAAVSGYAFGGGCYIALACDLVIATTSAKFGQQEINLGFMGASGLLPKLVGKHKAAEIVMIGDIFDAHEAYRLGLVNRVVKPENLMVEVKSFCNKLLQKSSYALKLTKLSIRIALETGFSVSSLYENELASLCVGTNQAKIEMKKFLNKTSNS